MKKLTTLVLLAGLVVSSAIGASKAQAAEFKPSAEFINQYAFGTGGSALGVEPGSNNYFGTQIELGFDYIASENLSGAFLVRVVQTYGSGEFDSQWSTNEDGGGAMLVRLAYIDWIIPSTDVQVRMGYQPIAMPAFAFGSAVLDTRGSGITVVAPINDNINLSAFWIRASSTSETDSTTGKLLPQNDTDLFGIMGDFAYDGFRVAPWAMYASIGGNSGYIPYAEDLAAYSGTILNPINDEETLFKSADAWYIGASIELSMFDPFTFALDAYYSNTSYDMYSERDYDYDGFYVGAAFSYATDYGVPALKTWYATGTDLSDIENGRHNLDALNPIIPAFAATSIMFDDDVLDEDPFSNKTGGNPAGTWGIMLEWSDLSFIENLSHVARIAYIGGTNDIPRDASGDYQSYGIAFLDSSESVVEINFNSTYEIYKNFSTTLELGWLTADFNEHFHNGEDDDIIRAALTFVYSF